MTTDQWSPDTHRQRSADFTLEDVHNLPDDVGLLRAWFRAHASEEFKVGSRLGIEWGPKDSFEPDVLLLRADPVHIYAYDLIGDRHELVADSDEELVLSAPFEIRLPIRDIAP
jgi:hypothetical protein